MNPVPQGEGASFSPLKLLVSPFDPLLLTAFDSGSYNGVSYAVYRGATGILPTYAYFAKGCILIQSTDSNIFINTATGLTTPVWKKVNSTSTDSSVTVSLTSAQILALHTTPITLVPAVSGKSIIVDSYVFTMNFVTSAYTGANNVEFRYTNGTGTKVAADTPSTVLDISSGTANYLGTNTASLLSVNSPVVAVVPTANPAAGAGNAVVTINYRLV